MSGFLAREVRQRNVRLTAAAHSVRNADRALSVGFSTSGWHPAYFRPDAGTLPGILRGSDKPLEFSPGFHEAAAIALHLRPMPAVVANEADHSIAICVPSVLAHLHPDIHCLLRFALD
jgi:hypothetical protein